MNTQPRFTRRWSAALLIPLVFVAARTVAGLRGAERNLTNSPATQQSGKVAGNAQNGKASYEKAGCHLCHGSQGEGASGTGSSSGVPRIASTSLPFTEFLQQVRKPKGPMPPFGAEKVSDAELTDVYAYLQSLKPMQVEPASAASSSKGARLYKDYGCYECHGFQGQGSASTGGARLGPPRIPLSAFVSYIRQPTGEMPPYTAKVVSDEEASEIYNFLKSVPPPPPLNSVPLLNP